MVELLISGEAGTGKTYSLIEETKAWVDRKPLLPHQQVLGLSVYHGSRIRLIGKFKEHRVECRYMIRTLDSFMLFLVNRFRKTLNMSRPVFPELECVVHVDSFGTRASHEAIAHMAAKLLESKRIGTMVASAFPLIVIDEFQDVTDHKLAFAKRLATHAALIVAADDFQALDGDTSAVDWLIECGVDTKTLTHNFRNASEIQLVTHAIRANVANSQIVRMVVCAQTYKMAPYQNVLFYPNQLPIGRTAIISPNRGELKLLIEQGKLQHAKQGEKGKKFILPSWQSPPDTDTIILSEVQTIREHLLENGNRQNASSDRGLDRRLIHTISRLREHARDNNTTVSQLSEEVIRFYHGHLTHAQYIRSGGSLFTALTIHAAKNQEFDTVTVLWDLNKIKKRDIDAQRRLLYNAVSRAKRSCSILTIGSTKKAESDPVLRLLGQPRNLF